MADDLISLVIPVNNEAASLPALFAEINTATTGLTAEMVVVDDGSTDDSWSVIRQASTADPRVRGLRFAKQHGKTAALIAGFAAARGTVIITLDADLQDDPAEIPRFLEAMKDLDVVNGWKQHRRDGIVKKLSSRAFNATVRAVSGVKLHDHNCGYKACRVEVLRTIPLDDGLHRFIPVLAAQRGFRVGEIAIRHRPRKFGRSHYGLWRIVPGLRDLFRVCFTTVKCRPPQEQYTIAETT